MSFDPGVPNLGSTPSEQQEDILNNFLKFNTDFAYDHYAFDAVANNGYHKKISFSSTETNPGLISPRSAIYPKAFTDSNNNVSTQLMFQLQQLTNLFASDSTFVENDNGLGIITPWGFRFNCGQFSVQRVPPSLAITKDITFPVAYTNLNYTVIITPITNVSGKLIWSIGPAASLNLFTFNGVAPIFNETAKFFYFAIGQ